MAAKSQLTTMTQGVLIGKEPNWQSTLSTFLGALIK
jgi:hypothetical protein